MYSGHVQLDFIRTFFFEGWGVERGKLQRNGNLAATWSAHTGDWASEVCPPAPEPFLRLRRTL